MGGGEDIPPFPSKKGPEKKSVADSKRELPTGRQRKPQTIGHGLDSLAEAQRKLEERQKIRDEVVGEPVQKAVEADSGKVDPTSNETKDKNAEERKRIKELREKTLAKATSSLGKQEKPEVSREPAPPEPIKALGKTETSTKPTPEIAEISPEDKLKIKEFAKYARFKNPPTKPESIAFFNKYEKEILDEAEKLNKEKQERWDSLSDEAKVDFIVSNIKAGNRDWFPWELEFRKYNSETVELRLRGSVAQEIKKEDVPKPIEVKKPEPSPEEKKRQEEKERKEAEKKMKEIDELAWFVWNEGEMNKKQKELYDANIETIEAKIRDLAKSERKAEKNITAAGEVIGKREKVKQESIQKVSDQRVLGIIQKMNIDTDVLYNLSPDFFDLDPNKQIYILEKIRQKVNLDASFEAEERVKKDLSRKTESVKDWFKKKFQGFTKEFEETKAKRAVMGEARENGMIDYADDIQTMTNHVKNLELPITYDSNGKLRIEYVDPNFFPKEMEYEKRFKKGETTADYVSRFNESATALSEIPDEWRLSKFTWDKKKYNEAKRKYEIHKSILFGAVLEKFQKETPDEKQAEAKAMFWMNNMDSQIEMNQLLTTHPELEKDENKGFWSSLNADDVNPAYTKWGLARLGMASGIAGRVLTRTNLGLQASVIFGGALGGFLAGRKKWMEYTDKEKKKRYGVAGMEDKGIKRFLDAEPQIDKLEILLERFELENDLEKKQNLAEMLQNRVMVLDERKKAGRFNFGGKNEILSNKLKLNQLLAQTNTRLFTEGFYNNIPESREFLGRFNKIQKDNQAKWARRTEVAKAFGWGALKASGGALAGWFLADLYMEHGSSQPYFPDRIKEILHEGGEGKWNDVQPGYQPTNPPANWNPELNPDLATPVHEVSLETPAEPASTAIPEAPMINQHVEIDQKGASGAFAKLREKIIETYADGKIPEALTHFVETPPDTLTHEYGFAVGDKSALLEKGASFDIENGELVYTDGSGVEHVIDKDHPYSGKFLGGEPELAPTPESTAETPTNELTETELRPTETPEPEVSSFEQVKSDTIARGFEHEQANFGDVFSKEVPLDDSITTSGVNENVPPTEDLDVSDVKTETNHFEHGKLGGENVKDILNEDGQRILSFNSNEVRGQIKFVYDPDTGEVTDLQASKQIGQRFNVSEENLWNRHMEDNWQNKLGNRLAQEVQGDTREYIKLKAVLKYAGFGEDSPEYRYLNKTLASIIERHGDLIKEETIFADK